MRTIRSRLPFVFAFGLLCFVVYLAEDLRRSSAEHAVSSFNSYQSTLARHLAHATTERLEDTSGVLLHLANVTLEPGFGRNELRDTLRAFASDTPGFQKLSITATDERGSVVYSNDGTQSLPGLPASRMLDWARNIRSRGHVQVFVRAVDTESPDGRRSPTRLAIATPYWWAPSPGTGPRFGGMLLASIDLEAILSGQMPTGPGGHPLGFWILDDDGTVLLQTEHPEMVLSNLRKAGASCLTCHATFDYAERMLSVRQGTTEYQLKGQPAKLAAFAPVTYANISWIVVVNGPQDTVTSFVRRNVRQIYLIVGLVIVAFAAASWSVYRDARLRAQAQHDARVWQEKHELEESLRRTETSYRTLFERSPDGVLIIDPWTTVPIDFNESAHRALGYSREEFAKLRVADYEAVEAPQDTEERISTLLRTGKANFETMHLTKLGALRRVEVSVQRIELDGRTLFHCIYHDITDRRRAEDEAARMHRQNSLILDSVTDGILGLDENGRHTFVNAAASRLLGWEPDEMIGRPSHSMWHHTKADGSPYTSATCPIYAAYRDGKVHHASDETFWRKDGTPLSVDFTSTPIRENTRLVGAVVAFRDLTERRMAEQAVRESETYFRALIENAMDIISVLNLDGTIRYQSPSIERTLGYGTNETIGRNVFEFVHPDDRERVEMMFFNGRTTPGSINSAVCRFRHKDGSYRTLEATGRNLSGTPGVRGVVINSRDITEKKRLESQLHHAQKMEAIGTLAGGIAHDFNNILGAIIGNTDLAAFDLPSDHQAQEYLGEISRATRRASDLVRQILTFSRKSDQELHAVSLAPIATEALKLVRATLSSTIAIESDIDADTPPVNADPTQLYQIIVNLAANSAHAMRERGGLLTIEVGPVAVGPEKAATHPDLRVGRYARLAVGDTGHGMDGATLERIFEPFFTTKASGEGTGLGLAVVHGIVKSLDGAILVQSEPGKGTRFEILLPAEVSQPHDLHSASVIPRGHGERVLFIDDEPALGKIAEKILDSLGYQVESETSSESALARFLAPGRAYDLVVTDLSMPGMSGLDLARRILGAKPDQAVMLMTGYSGSLRLERARQLGIRAVHHKPLDRGAFGRAVFEALQSRDESVGA